MKLTLEMNLDSAAFFENDPAAEIRRCLSAVVDGIDSLPSGPNGVSDIIRDSNGNTVGKWKVTE